MFSLTLRNTFSLRLYSGKINSSVEDIIFTTLLIESKASWVFVFFNFQIICSISSLSFHIKMIKHGKSEDSSREKKYVTLSEYVSRMKEDQKDIYFVSGKDVELIDKMPVVQTLKNKEFEVLYLTDEVDEFVMQTLMNYKEKTFRNAAQGDLDLDTEEEKEALNKSKEENKDLLTFMKEALGDEVAEVKLSNKLTEDPVCLTAGEGISFEMEKGFANMPNQSPMPMKATRILEINPNHPIFETLKTLYASDKDKVKEVTEVLYDQACLIEGFAIKDPIAYSKKICELLVK